MSTHDTEHTREPAFGKRAPFALIGLTRKRRQGYLLIIVAMAMLFGFLHRTARQAVITEVRSHAMGVAIATAAGIDSADIAMVRGQDDMQRLAYKRLQQYLGFISAANHDVRFIYTMRRVSRPGAKHSDYEYIVDQPASDNDGDGVVGADEISELPGTPYDASELPEMIAAWDRPAADFHITPDPPYPDLISGYAPIRNSKGQTVAIVGVDITAGTVRRKLTAIRVALLVVAVIVTLLIITMLQLYYQQKEALEHIRQLGDTLEDKNALLRSANDELAAHNARFERDLKLAQSVQEGFLQTHSSRTDRVVFDNFYLSCDVLGGDLFDVFKVGQDRVGMYIADVAGEGVSAAMISSLLKMAVQSVRDDPAAEGVRLHTDLHKPDVVLQRLNDMLNAEIPDYEFITMLYAVLDLNTTTFTVASAGHPPPLHYVAARQAVETWDLSRSVALGLQADVRYESRTVHADEGDRILFFTDGLTEAMNERNEEFGEERARQAFSASAAELPDKVLAAMRAAVEQHLHGLPVNDEFSMLLAEFRAGPPTA